MAALNGLGPHRNHSLTRSTDVFWPVPPPRMAGATAARPLQGHADIPVSGSLLIRARFWLAPFGPSRSGSLVVLRLKNPVDMGRGSEAAWGSTVGIERLKVHSAGAAQVHRSRGVPRNGVPRLRFGGGSSYRTTCGRGAVPAAARCGAGSPPGCSAMCYVCTGARARTTKPRKSPGLLTWRSSGGRRLHRIPVV